jgi:uncharacterized protein (DUF1697 family)
MPRYVAFLRALNVGNRRVKMDRLRDLLTELRLGNVTTFIASGNVIFDAPGRDATKLAATIAAHLETSLGFNVPTLVRTPAEIAEAVAATREQEGHALHLVFLERAPTADEAARIVALGNDVDRFEVAGRELRWWCRGRTSDSTVTATRLERAAGMRGTARSISSLRKLMELAGAP